MSKKKQSDLHSAADFWTELFSTMQTLIVYGAYSIMAYFAYKSIESLAGKNTSAVIDVKGQASANVDLSEKHIFGFDFAETDSCVVISAYAILVTLFLIRERRSKRQKISQLTSRLQIYERRIDSNKQTSGLSSDGTTNPRDRK